MSNYILKHHGIKGQKWGVRRFQNADGTRTTAGKKRYADLYDPSEDNSSYKYQKPGESGWTGAKRAMKAKAKEHREAYVKRNKLVKERNQEANANLVSYTKSEAGKRYRKGQRQFAGGMALGLIGNQPVGRVFQEAGRVNTALAKRDAKREANQFIKEKYGDQAYKEVKKRDVRNGAIAVASVMGAVGYQAYKKKQG